MDRFRNVLVQHEKYVAAASDVKDTIDEAFDSVVRVFKSHGIRAAIDDDAEELVAALYRYYECSLSS